MDGSLSMCARQPTSGYTLTFPTYLHAETIHIVGDFNGWNQRSHPLRRTVTGEWAMVWPQRTRCRQFYLLLDSTRWLTVDSIDFLLLERWHALPPSAVFTWAGQSMAMRQFLAWIDSWCDTLAYVGVAKGAVVALPQTNTLTTFALLLALLWRQCIVSPFAQNSNCPWMPVPLHNWPDNLCVTAVEWCIHWHDAATFRCVRQISTASHQAIDHLRSLNHPGLLSHTPQAQNPQQICVLDVIDYLMPSTFRQLLLVIQDGFSSETSNVCAVSDALTLDRCQRVPTLPLIASLHSIANFVT